MLCTQIFFNIHEEDSLNNRFKPIQGPHTDGVFAGMNYSFLVLSYSVDWAMIPIRSFCTKSSNILCLHVFSG
jgi:hypothetical protein